jgi:hypothetical protein
MNLSTAEILVDGSKINSVMFMVKVVEYARGQGYELNSDVWEADRAIFRVGAHTEEMHDELVSTYDSALDFLNEHTFDTPFTYEVQENKLVIVEE